MMLQNYYDATITRNCIIFIIMKWQAIQITKETSRTREKTRDNRSRKKKSKREEEKSEGIK